MIAVANTTQWERLKDATHLTTTNICKHELQNHVSSNKFPPEGSREYYLKRGSQRIPEHLDEASSPWSCVTVIDAVERLTKTGEESYEEFVAGAAPHPIARAVKQADIEDNMDLTRLDAVDTATLDRIEKYHDSWKQLQAEDNPGSET